MTATSARPRKRKPLSARAKLPLVERLRLDFKADWSRSDAFLRLPAEERERRVQAFIDHFAPAFAGYSSGDFRADQRREAECDG